MGPSQADSLRQDIDAEIKALEGSIRVLKHRRNALAPVSSLPTDLIVTIFSILRAESSSIIPGKKPDHLAWLHVAHVCHGWREIALNQPLFWSYLDFTIVSSAGATEILSRAKKVPLHLEAQIPFDNWDDARFSALRKDLQDHVSHIRHFDLSTEFVRFNQTLNGLTSPAPTLEHLSLTCLGGENTIRMQGFITDNLFGGSTPRLSHLELRHCVISWKSPLLRGLKHLKISLSFERPSLSIWLDALSEMAQLKTLILFKASPIAPFDASLSSSVKRTVTLPYLTHFEMTSLTRGCGLVLAHLVLPALITLCITAESCCRDGSDVPQLLPHVSRHAHGTQHTQPLQSAFIRSHPIEVEILAWSEPDIDVKLPNERPIFCTMYSARVEFSLMNIEWSPGTHMRVFDAAIAALSLNSLVTLTTEKQTRLDKQFWLRHTPQWPLLRRMRLGSLAACGFREMLAEDNRGRGSSLLPSLTKLVLVDTALSARWTLHLCDALMKRVEQGIPLETLDLSTCLASSRTVELFSEIGVEVLSPEELLGSKKDNRGRFFEDNSSNDEVWPEEETNDDPNASEDEFI